MKNGFYRLSRGWMDNPVFSSSRSFDRRSAWIWLIENACFKDTKQDVLGKTIKVERGYLYCSLSQLVREWSWSEKAVRTFLKRLSNDHMIDMYTGDGKTRIFIVNYDVYQWDGRTFDDKATRYRQQKKEGKEGKELIIHTDLEKIMSNEEFKKFITALYPKRDGALNVTRAYDRIVDLVKKNKMTFSQFFRAVKNYKRACEDQGIVGTKYIQQVSTFSNKNWMDYDHVSIEPTQGPWSPF